MKKPRVLLDSGAYTVSRKGKQIDIKKYARFIQDNGKFFDGCFNLDVIGNGKASYENWLKLKSLGVETIPVFHNTTDPKFLKRYMDETDYIGIGAIANLNTNLRILHLNNLWNNYIIDPATNKPRVKTHGLGLTNVSIMTAFPWFSVDSFTPVISAVWGSILLPTMTSDGKFDWLDVNIYRVSDQANAKAGTTRNYLSIPQRSQQRYVQLMEKLGFNLGQITYQEKRPRRGRKDKTTTLPDTMFDLTKPSDSSIKTLANHWEERMRWNLTVWTRLQRRLPDIKTYMGVSTTTHLGIFEMVKPKIDILISYAYLSDNIWEAIKKYIA
jgi:hypothetical protein